MRAEIKIFIQKCSSYFWTNPKSVHEVFSSSNGGCAEIDVSPVKDTILFRCWGDYEGFYTINIDGSNLSKIDTGDIGGIFPTWSPSGENFAFKSFSDINSAEGAKSAVYIADANGANLIKLTTNNEENILWFSWVPSYESLPTCYLFCK